MIQVILFVLVHHDWFRPIVRMTWGVSHQLQKEVIQILGFRLDLQSVFGLFNAQLGVEALRRSGERVRFSSCNSRICCWTASAVS